ncbi:putative carbonic anhydrase 2 [Medicago truncatula]|uniref:Nodule-specific glycine-rich protein 3C n=1 Tax=Medicago truncatula TaxID=3880 RepID=A7KHI4_MEDTR|nr:putative carbonic anhydrase 2 [Medicago truncatula]ABS31491.1 nodule-specific glycine-rich protein 3C [Medicago truncatula]
MKIKPFIYMFFICALILNSIVVIESSKFGAREESKTNTGIDGLTDSEGRRQNGGGNGRGAKGEGERNGSVKDNGGRTDNKRSGRIGEGWHLRGPIDSGGGFNSKNKNGGRTRRGRLP